MWFSAPSFWMGGGLESRCVGRVYGADGAVLTPTNVQVLKIHFRLQFTNIPTFSSDHPQGV